MKYRKYVYCFTLMIIIFVSSHFLIWKCYTEKLFNIKYGAGGDLARVGYLPSFKLQRKNHNDLPRHHFSLREYIGQPVDMLTLGDSFTNGVGGGRNRYYQDYIATINKMSVLNVGLYKRAGSPPFLGPIQTLILLINSGELDIISPRIILLSASVKQAVTILSDPVDFRLSIPSEKVKDTHNYEWYDIPVETLTSQPSLIPARNLKFIYYTLLHLLANRTDNGIAIAPMERKLFSVAGNNLLYAKHDVVIIPSNNRKALEQINANLNQIAELLSKKGIKLYFMPCVDKYDLYNPFIVNNAQPMSSFFETFRQLPKRYTFIDTKQILSKQLEEGVQDVFYPDDTHWSWKASQRIFETVRFR